MATRAASEAYPRQRVGRPAHPRRFSIVTILLIAVLVATLVILAVIGLRWYVSRQAPAPPDTTEDTTQPPVTDPVTVEPTQPVTDPVVTPTEPAPPPPPEGYPALPDGWEWRLTSSGKKYVAFGKIGTPRAPCAGTVRSLWSNNGAGFLLENRRGDPVVAITIPGSNEASLGIRSVDVEKGETLPWITDRSACVEFGFKLNDASAVAFAREVVYWLLGE